MGGKHFFGLLLNNVCLLLPSHSTSKLKIEQSASKLKMEQLASTKKSQPKSGTVI